jgi:hypothetical protein
MTQDSTSGARMGQPAAAGDVPDRSLGTQPADAPSFVQFGQPGLDSQPPYRRSVAGEPMAQPVGESHSRHSAEHPFAAPYQQWPVAHPGVDPTTLAYNRPLAGGRAAAGKSKWSVLAIIGFVVGVVVVGISLFSGIVVLAVAPIALSIRALQDVRRTGKKGIGLAIAGVVLGGISALLYLINIVGR